MKYPHNPKHPERICWGCQRLCPAKDLACGNGSERTQHPSEIFGDDWVEWSADYMKATSSDADARSDVDEVPTPESHVPAAAIDGLPEITDASTASKAASKATSKATPAR